MQPRLFRPCLLTLMIAALACANLFTDRVSAQEGGAKLWSQTAIVAYKPKPDRKPSAAGTSTTGGRSNTGGTPNAGGRRRTERKTLLTLQWRVFERESSGVGSEVDPNKVFAFNDQIRLAITANQPGHLYIVNQPLGKDGILLFPDPNVNGGENFVEKNKEYVVPNSCVDQPDPKDCWMEWSAKPETENLIVIFSRDEITTLPGTVKSAHDKIKREDIENIVARSSKKVRPLKGYAIPGLKPARYATWVQNIDTTDNEDLVTTIKIKHGE